MAKILKKEIVNRLYEQNNNSAFTIVELLVVIVVIGILAAITIVSYSGISQRAIAVAIEANLSENAKLLNLYRVEFDSYPTLLNAGNCPTLPTVSNSYCLKTNNGDSIESYVGSKDEFTLTIKHDDNNVYSIGQDNTVAKVESGGGSGGGSSWKYVSAGDYQNCYLDNSNARVYCYGENDKGQLGNNSMVTTYTPVAVYNSGVLAGKTFKTVDSGLWHTCTIASDDKAYCWGGNNRAQLGNAVEGNSSVPVAVDTSGVLSGKTIKQIAAGTYHTCVIANDDLAYCWGGSDVGQLGNAAVQPDYTMPYPTAVTTTGGVLNGKTFKQLSVGSNTTCAIASDDKAYCWGRNLLGELGDNSLVDSYVPVAVFNTGVLVGKTMVQISTDSCTTCALDSDGKAYCWGENSRGQLGNGTVVDSKIPVAVTMTGILTGITFKQISTSGSHTCAIGSDDNAYCWGYNNRGQLGDGTATDKLVPVKVDMDSLKLKQISAGYKKTCVVASDNNYYCWGRSTFGAE